MQRIPKDYRKSRVKNKQFGAYNFRVGDLWGNGSDVIVISDIYLHMTKKNEWLTVHYQRIDDLGVEYISEQMVNFINRNNFVPIQ